MTTIPKRILVIGGGPTGLVTLRNLQKLGGFEHVELYERRDDVGGVWNLDKDEHTKYPSWPSPAYPDLIGNVLPEYLSFSGFPFPEPALSPELPFPTLLETHQYLRDFSAPYIKSIKLSREVMSVSELTDQQGWSVTSVDWSNGGQATEEIWDAVVICVGWYDNPVWPKTEGLSMLRVLGIAQHAQSWRGPQSLEGKRVLIIGNGNSSNDMAAQLAPVASTPVYQSIRRPGVLRYPCLPDERIQMVPPVAQYTISADGSCVAHFEDGSILGQIDAVRVGTGYRPFPEFVRVLRPANYVGTEATLPLVTNSTVAARVPFLHRLIMNAYNPSLAFIGTTMAYTPFTLADLGSTWLALAWRGEVSYPNSVEGRLVFETERLQRIDAHRAQFGDSWPRIIYSILGDAEEEYASTMRKEIVDARPDLDKVLPVWNSEQTKKREGMYQVKYNSLAYARARLSDE